MFAKLLLVILCLVFSPPQEAREPEKESQFQPSTLKLPRGVTIHIDRPKQFIVGKFEKKDPPAFEDAVVLVEEKQLGSHEPASIPYGTPSIFFAVRNQEHFDLVKGIFREKSDKIVKTTAGRRTVYQFPGYPAPYGDGAFYYLVVLDKDEYLEIVADRFSRATEGSDTLQETRYDLLVQRMIQSLEVERKKPE